MKLKKRQFEQGSVMLETILVLPVYLMLLASTFYVGEISLYRNLLLELDGYDMQRQGNRYESKERSYDIVQFLFQIPEGTGKKWNGFQYEGMETLPPVVSSNRWWQENRVWNKGSLSIPSWIKGIFYLNTRSPSSNVEFQNNFVFYGCSGQKYSNGSVSYGLPFYSKKDSNQWRGGDNYQDPADLCKENTPMWTLIARENYCADTTAGSVRSGVMLSEYPRDGFDPKTGEGTSPYRVFSGEGE